MEIKVPPTILNEVSDYGIEEFVTPRIKFAVDSVVAKSPAQLAGIQKGDSIVRINQTQVTFFDQLRDQLQANKNKAVALQVKRAGDTVNLNATVAKDGTLGFRPKVIEPLSKTETYGVGSSLPVGASRAWGLFTDNAKGLGKVFKGDVKFNKAVSGPVAMAKMFGDKVNWVKFWTLVGLLSMALALMNLLPIPALDGGHALFLIIEMIKGKPLSDKFLERAQLVGFVILISLMVFVFGNDITKLIKKH